MMDTPVSPPLGALVYFRLSALTILVTMALSLGISLCSASSVTIPQVVVVTAHPTPTLAYRIKSGRTFNVIFDQTTGKFDDTRYAGNSDPMGTLKGGETYTVRYDLELGEWSTTGYNQGTGSVITRAYRNARLEDCTLSLWGRTYRFDNDGQVYDSQFGLVGRIEMP